LTIFQLKNDISGFARANQTEILDGTSANGSKKFAKCYTIFKKECTFAAEKTEKVVIFGRRGVLDARPSG